MTNANDTDDELRERLRSKLEFKSDGGDGAEGDVDDTDDIEQESNNDEADAADEDIEQEASDDHASQLAEEYDGLTADHVTSSLSLLADAAGGGEAVEQEAGADLDDETIGEMMAMFEQTLQAYAGDDGDGEDGDDEDGDGEDTADHPGELKADDIDGLGEKLEEKLDERVGELEEKLDDTVTQDDLGEVVDAVAGEMNDIVQHADTGGTTPSASSGGEPSLSTDDLLSGGDTE